MQEEGNKWAKLGKNRNQKSEHARKQISNNKVQPKVLLKNKKASEANKVSNGERVRNSVPVSNSISSTQRVEKRLRFKLKEEPKTTEKARAEETNNTQRNRFPLIKKSKAKENELIEKLFAKC